MCTVSAMQHWPYTQHWNIFMNLRVTRQVLENRGKKGGVTEVHMTVAPFPWDRLQAYRAIIISALLSYRQRLKFTKFFVLTCAFPISKYEPEFDPIFRLWLLNVKTSKQICPLRGRKVIFGLVKIPFPCQCKNTFFPKTNTIFDTLNPFSMLRSGYYLSASLQVWKAVWIQMFGPYSKKLQPTQKALRCISRLPQTSH